MYSFDRRNFLNRDWIILGAVVVIAAMGLANLYSAGYESGIGGTPFYLKQLTYYLLGFVIVFVISCFDYRLLHKLNYPLYTIIILLLLFVLLWGESIAQTNRWIDLGFFRLQPSEPAKLMLVITLASYFARKETGTGFSLKQLLVPIVLTALPFVLIVKQPDLGTALMLWVLFLSMIFFVYIKLNRTTSWFLIIGGVASLPIGWFYVLKPYQRDRIWSWIQNVINQGEADSLGSGYHIDQSKIAIGSGQVFGKGYLAGTQGHLHFLPERHTDFAFAVWAEEWGFVGCLIFLAVYFFMIFWGLKIGFDSRDRFGMLLAVGVVSLIFWQAVINLLMITGWLPVVGIPLPLFSYGGSSLITTMTGIGILISIHQKQSSPKE